MNIKIKSKGPDGKATPTYISFKCMKERCASPKHAHFKYYGGRGIKVCDRWKGLKGFQNFVADMGARPDGKTIDRIDVNGNYEPSNCKWATMKTQARNRSSTKLCPASIKDIRSMRGTQAYIASLFGVSQPTISKIKRGLLWAEDLTA